VIEEIAIGGTHNNASFRRPSSGASVFLDHTPGVPLRSTPGFSSGAPSGCYQRSVSRARAGLQSRSAEGAADSSPSGALVFWDHTPGAPLRSTRGFNSSAPSGCSRGNSSSYCAGFRGLAPKARRNTARSAAQQTPGIGWAMSSNPWQGVAEWQAALNVRRKV
jgi:hypothetical protein